jgi:DNA polymerase-3 subunit chi
VAETLFYHLERRALDDVLPGLVQKSLERGWRALICADSAERAEAIDTLLWTFDDQSFLPHAHRGDGDTARQPVLVGMETGNDNGAQIMFCVGSVAPDWNAVAALSRIVLMFDGRDEAALASARAAWKDAKAAGHDVTYWKETPSGKFEKQN